MKKMIILCFFIGFVSYLISPVFADENEEMAWMEKTAQENPTNPAGWAFLGYEAYTRQKDFPKAVEYFKKAAEADNGSPGLHYYMASAYMEMGNREEAKKEFETAISLADKNIMKIQSGEDKIHTAFDLKELQKVKEECKMGLDDVANSTNNLLETKKLESYHNGAIVKMEEMVMDLENYKKGTGAYPRDLNELLAYTPKSVYQYNLVNKDKPAFVNLFTSDEMNGYRFSREFSPGGYKITATPLECGKTGRKIFIIENGKKLAEEECK